MHLAVLAILVPDLLAAMRAVVVAEADAVLVLESTLLLTMAERAAAGVQGQMAFSLDGGPVELPL